MGSLPGEAGTSVPEGILRHPAGKREESLNNRGFIRSRRRHSFLLPKRFLIIPAQRHAPPDRATPAFSGPSDDRANPINARQPVHQTDVQTWCGRRDLNPHTQGVSDFKSEASADSATTARFCYYTTVSAAAQARSPFLNPEFRNALRTIPSRRGPRPRRSARDSARTGTGARRP